MQSGIYLYWAEVLVTSFPFYFMYYQCNKKGNFAVKYVRSQKPKFNYRHLNDPIADNTKWITTHKGPFTQRRIIDLSDLKLVMRTPIALLLLYTIPAIIGLIVLITFSIVFYEDFGLISILIGLLFGGFALWMGIGSILKQSVSAFFNKEVGYFWTSRKIKTEFSDFKKAHCKLSDIHAIQLIHDNSGTLHSGSHRGRSGGSYEMNLILKDSKRINVFTNKNREKSQNEAKILAEFLKVHFWDATVG